MLKKIATCVASAGLLFATTAFSQQSPPASPALDQALAAIGEQFSVFVRTVPSLFAEERVVSSASGAVQGDHSKTTDSIFRLKREIANGRPRLTESRESKIGAKAGAVQSVEGPSILRGVFSTAMMDFSKDRQRCFDYQLETNQKWKSLPVIVVDLQPKSGLSVNSGCPVLEAMSGHAYLDPKTMQVLHVEEDLPAHEIFRGVRGEWKWSVDYVATDLDGKPFWLPQQITSISSLKNIPPAEWTFTATYRSYHQLAVTSKILANDQ